MVFCRSMLVLLATSRDSSSSVIWIWSFFLMRVTSDFSLVSASTTRAFSCSISMLVCLLQTNKHVSIKLFIQITIILHFYIFSLKGYVTFYLSKSWYLSDLIVLRFLSVLANDTHMIHLLLEFLSESSQHK